MRPCISAQTFIYEDGSSTNKQIMGVAKLFYNFGYSELQTVIPEVLSGSRVIAC